MTCIFSEEEQKPATKVPKKDTPREEGDGGERWGWQTENNRRADKIMRLRQELRLLTKQCNGASKNKKARLAELHGIQRKKNSTLSSEAEEADQGKS